MTKADKIFGSLGILKEDTTIYNYFDKQPISVQLDFINKNYLYFAVASTIDDHTYGYILKTPGNIFFIKHKSLEINKGKNPPRICSETQKSVKEISKEEMDKYFRLSSHTEICYFEMRDDKEREK